MDDVLRGRVAWVFGDHFDVDLTIGVQNIKVSDPEQLVAVCMRDYDPDFKSLVRPGDILVAGRNFGYGHPHWPAMIAIRHLGINCIVADSFSPGFWRGELFAGMVLVTCPGISKSVRRWDEIEVRWKEGSVRCQRTGEVLQSEVPDDRTVQVVEAGGFLAFLKTTLGSPPISRTNVHPVHGRCEEG